MSFYENEKIENHESYGLVGISRISGRNENLFATDIVHDSWLEIRIKHCEVKRGLHQEWYHSKGRIISVYLTHSQFSEMISNPNCGDGVPCTINQLMGKNIERPKKVNRAGQYDEEFKQDMEKLASRLDNAISDMNALLSKNGATKKEKSSLLRELQMIKQDIGKNMPFVEKQFRRCLTKATDDAKRNIEGHALNLALNAAQRGFVTKQESEEMIEGTNSNNILIGYDQED